MKLLFVFLTALGIVGCGPLPRPFIDQEPQNNTLLQLSGTRPIAIEPPAINLPISEGQIPDLAIWIQNTLSADVRDQGLPASNYSTAQNSLYVHSNFTTISKSASQTQLKMEVFVTEVSPSNSAVISFEEHTVVPAPLLSNTPKPILNELIKRASLKLNNEIIALTPTGQDKAISPVLTGLTLLPLPELLAKPTQEILVKELQTSLLLRGYKLHTSISAHSDYDLKLEIDREVSDDNYFLTLRWILFEKKTSEEIGVIAQRNPVPNIALSRVTTPRPKGRGFLFLRLQLAVCQNYASLHKQRRIALPPLVSGYLAAEY
ncbi:hypothetical protein [Kiloniella sp.]|uniref:hypothetical protein n=1 Tax=Kiloniella sp. TaxID=1938587 RepID=UPI003B02E1B7